MTKLDLKLLIFFVLFVGLGITAAFQYGYIEDSRAFRMSIRWLLIPSLALGAYYSHYSIFRRGPDQAKWKKNLGLLGLTLFASLAFLKASQGYLIFWNSHVGRPTSIVVQGYISKVEAPRRKKLLGRYSIEIIDSPGHTVSLLVPGSNYRVGGYFSRELFKGSLTLIYGP